MSTDLGQPDARLAQAVEELRAAYQDRDMDRLMRLFADDASITLAPGVGVVVAGCTAVWGVTRKLVGYLVNEGKKGLDVTPS